MHAQEEVIEQHQQSLMPMTDSTQYPAPATAPHAPPAVQVGSAVTPMDLLQVAMNSGADLDRLERLMEMQRKWDAAQAEKAFNQAKSDLMAEAIRVSKDKENKQYDSTYTSLGNLVSTVTPFLSKHGFSHRWDIEQGDKIEVTCILSHRLGHSERVTFKCPPDTGGAKNPIQQIKSAITYAKGVTFESVCGLASTNANLDDDGKAAGLDIALADSWIDKLSKANTANQLKDVWDEGVEVIGKANDLHAYAEFKRAYTARKAEIEGATK